MKLKIKQIAQGNLRRMHSKNERLWATECILLHQRLCVMNEIRSFQAKNAANVVYFRRVRVARLLSDIELEALRQRFYCVWYHCGSLHVETVLQDVWEIS